MEESVRIVGLDRIPADGCNPSLDAYGRLRLTPELERVVEERVRAGIAQLACDLLDACRSGSGITTQRLQRALKPYAAEATHACGCCEQDFAGECRYWTTPAATVATICLACHDLLQEVGQRIVSETGKYDGATFQAWMKVRNLKRLAAVAEVFCTPCYHCSGPVPVGEGRVLPDAITFICGVCDEQAKQVAAFCNTCNGTGFDFYTHCPCPDCSQPNSPAPQQVQDAVGCPACNGSTSDPHAGYPGCFSGAAPAPNPPTSRCCGADVFEDRGRAICKKCRVGCRLR